MLRDLLATGEHASEITLTGVTPELREAATALGVKGRDLAGAWIVDVDGEAKVRELLTKALAMGASVDAVTPKRETLEAIFVRRVG